MNTKTIAGIAGALLVAAGTAYYEVASTECVDATYLIIVDGYKTQRIAKICGTKDGKSTTVAKELPEGAKLINVSKPKSKLLAETKLVAAAADLDSPCACAPWSPAKDAIECVQIITDPKGTSKPVKAPKLQTLLSGQWTGDCVKLATGCSISEVRDQCRQGDPCWMPNECRDPKQVETDELIKTEKLLPSDFEPAVP